MEWEKVNKFDRYENLGTALCNVGDFATVTIVGEENEVSADVIQAALKNSGKKNIKARDSLVFHVVDSDKKDWELWVSKTAYSSLSELKQIREENNNKFDGAKMKIERVAKEDMDRASFVFAKA